MLGIFDAIFSIIFGCDNGSPSSSSGSRIEKDFWGNPYVESGWFGERTIKIDGKSYDVIAQNSDRLVIKEPRLFGLGEEKIIEKTWLGNYVVREKGWFD